MRLTPASLFISLRSVFLREFRRTNFFCYLVFLPCAAWAGTDASVRSELEAALAAPGQLDRSRAHLHLGKISSDKNERLLHFESGLRLAESVRHSEPKNPEAILLWVANAGEIAALRKNLKSLNTILKIEAALKELKVRDASYGYSAADRGLGALYHQAPPWISIGSSRKARAHFEEALKRHPEFPGNQIHFAVFLEGEGDAQSARRIAQSVLDSQDLRRFGWEAIEWAGLARKILENGQDKR